MGTLLFDLLTEEESADRRNVFDIPKLAQRLSMATEWLTRSSGYVPGDVPIGLFGASTGGGAALWTAAGERLPAGALLDERNAQGICERKLSLRSLATHPSCTRNLLLKTSNAGALGGQGSGVGSGQPHAEVSLLLQRSNVWMTNMRIKVAFKLNPKLLDAPQT